MDTTAGLVSGRPHGGVALLWRKDAFDTVLPIECNNVRVCAINITVSNRSIVVFSVYMPTNSIENLPVFTTCLSSINSVMETEETKGVEAFYIIGDFNAHPNALFYNEMLQFCSEQSWLCVDVNMCDSDTYTFISESHGCSRWLDHCLVTDAARRSIVSVSVMYDVYWSDHLPLIVECDLLKINYKVINKLLNENSINNVIWGERTIEQIKEYHDLCNSSLSLINIPCELGGCSDVSCDHFEHRSYLDKMYSDITSTLSLAAAQTYRVKCRRKGGYITGWNKYVAPAHREARQKFQIWNMAGRPNTGDLYHDMVVARKHFKAKLKWCQNRQDQLKMDILASNHTNKNFKQFWKSTRNMNVRPSMPVSVGGVTDHKQIVNMFSDQFSVRSPLASLSCDARDSEIIVTRRNTRVPTETVARIISRMQHGKSPGHDGLSIEHFKHAGEHVPRVLTLFFTLCLSHSYLPEPLMRTMVVPIVKNKTGDTSELSNYRPISLATTIAMVFDSVLNDYLSRHIEVHDAQFGFRSGVSTESAILSLKHTVKYYTTRKTPVYACFLDLSIAFDLVSYVVLWDKLRDAGVPEGYTALLRYWYTHQTNQVRWVRTLSDVYRMECGVRQGRG